MVVGKVLVVLASVLILHAAYSTYEHLSLLKALDRPEESLPHDIVAEVLVALVLGIIGATLSVPQLKEISWMSEMQKRRIDEFDARRDFMSVHHRGPIIFGGESTKTLS